MLWALLEMHETQPLPDLELFVAATDFAIVTSRNEDGGLTPVFKARRDTELL